MEKSFVFFAGRGIRRLIPLLILRAKYVAIARRQPSLAQMQETCLSKPAKQFSRGYVQDYFSQQLVSVNNDK